MEKTMKKLYETPSVEVVTLERILTDSEETNPETEVGELSMGGGVEEY